MSRGNQLIRQWQLLQLIERPAGFAVDDAANALGCTGRTIWRDLKVLQEAGFPLYDDKDPGRGGGLAFTGSNRGRRVPHLPGRSG